MRLTRRTGTATAALLCALLAGAASGCQQGGTSGRSPFIGKAARPAPVLAVKIDNVRAARPQTGLDGADLVYVERVEAGLSRLLAVYSSRLPESVGPVRSARESDLELLRQFGRPAFAYSGTQTKLDPVVEAAPLYPVPLGKAGGAYSRSKERAAPHNLYVSPARALKAAPNASTARDIGFRFGAAPSGGRTTSSYTARYPSARFTFDWSAERHGWLVSMDGDPVRATGGQRLAVPTVVVQGVRIHASRYHDRMGAYSPYTETTGAGPARVLRDGKAYEAHWSRPSADGGTDFTTASGARLAFASGQVWVVYVPQDEVGGGSG
ncbi:Putative lipoprotein YerB precursor [Streptomyces rimosus subsp. rimosus]|uniref:Lipoprotein YerB n=1 Tax=Streptomyces rimosus subsp. rimosus TaxID=132474 RepID=A0ABY3ZGZ1_STRRM|nr:DUF3048 domain-containing protein [Streptomyces rimosus]UNZ07719.1 Putative lipoprotein YerB precursor [Streptomyces rimosus subsp. rimosus]UTH93598.1 Putative lipoprotein YerB precursor [Streptomyces rimosus subsp. rimosus]UTJ11693.1 Putative lipoprotein YerB precursor [Streptomyces rimosus subsp. rimosus]